jgi:hypothetical protein
MAYEKTLWKSRQGSGLNRFSKSEETADSVVLTNAPDAVSEQGTPFTADQMNRIEEGIAEAHDLISAETNGRQQALAAEAQARQAADSDINGKIPNQASAENQLADKEFVNSSITAMAARPLAYDASGGPFPTKADLDGAANFYYQGQIVTPSDNDYVVVEADETRNGAQVRYGYAGGVWAFRYKINDAPFTAAQNAALNSGATAGIIASVASKQEKISAVGLENLLTAPAAAGGQPGAKAIADFAQKSETVNDLLSDSPDLPLSAAMGKYLKGLIDNLSAGTYPIGSIYMSVKPDNPSAYFGGTWVAWGSGRVPVGVDAAQTEFTAVEAMGGAKTHTLTPAQMPSHTHIQNSHAHIVNIGGSFGTPIRGVTGAPDGGVGQFGGILVGTTATNQYTGDGNAHNNLQPYITCYMFKRTA